METNTIVSSTTHIQEYLSKIDSQGIDPLNKVGYNSRMHNKLEQHKINTCIHEHRNKNTIYFLVPIVVVANNGPWNI